MISWRWWSWMWWTYFSDSYVSWVWSSSLTVDCYLLVIISGLTFVSRTFALVALEVKDTYCRMMTSPHWRSDNTYLNIHFVNTVVMVTYIQRQLVTLQSTSVLYCIVHIICTGLYSIYIFWSRCLVNGLKGKHSPTTSTSSSSSTTCLPILPTINLSGTFLMHSNQNLSILFILLLISYYLKSSNPQTNSILN